MVSFTLNYLLKILLPKSPNKITLGARLRHTNMGDTIQSMAKGISDSLQVLLPESSARGSPSLQRAS
jgi:hypothetical protein